MDNNSDQEDRLFSSEGRAGFVRLGTRSKVDDGGDSGILKGHRGPNLGKGPLIMSATPAAPRSNFSRDPARSSQSEPAEPGPAMLASPTVPPQSGSTQDFKGLNHVSPATGHK
ncbi:hypothetical protein PAAG_11297 [Paracoccidioides lutzii Pb01]|uniref:Uncharacterized protein n=1 Tax=Paracoccidioides lutzii (strain ATCC MYA-826 / Pb01) TaxID=502779 RepID=A0A0A2V6C8_PARBA|nr:hypothetical protein PAAG_11297 [Paracoccidioides lutzii Pb01]KGQ01907.1 hypothetical protein PAAG_11297 [Paracoccidioides lutzii Pb01]